MVNAEELTLNTKKLWPSEQRCPGPESPSAAGGAGREGGGICAGREDGGIKREMDESEREI